MLSSKKFNQIIHFASFTKGKKVKPMNRLASILIIIIFSNGCAGAPTETQSKSAIYNVISFHKIEGEVEGKTIKVLPFDKSLGNSLQFQNYAESIEDYLYSSGFSAVNENQEPDYIVFLSYGMGSGKESVVSETVTGRTGGGTTSRSGSVYGSGGSVSYYGTSYTMPTYGIVGSTTYSETNYTSNLALDIVDASSLKSDKPTKIYEGRVKSTGSCTDLNSKTDYMIIALFWEFPGISGASSMIPGLDC
jgi:hypothetical protein